MSGLTISSKEMAAQSEFCTERSLLGCIGTTAKVAGFTGGGSMILGFGALIAMFVGVTMPFLLPVGLLLGGFALYAASATKTGFEWDAIEERKNFGIKTVNSMKSGALNDVDCFSMLKKQKITPEDFFWLADHCELGNNYNEMYKEFYNDASELPLPRLEPVQERKPTSLQGHSYGGAIILQETVALKPERCQIL